MTTKTEGNNGYTISAKEEDSLTLYTLKTFTNCRDGFAWEISTLLTVKHYKTEKAAVKAGNKDLAARA